MQPEIISIERLVQEDKYFISRDKCWDNDYQRMYGGKLVPPLAEYTELVMKILPIMLTNGTRDDINRFEQGMWEQVVDGAYFRSAIYTSENISIDARLGLAEYFESDIRYFRDLRVFYSNERFYFKNIVTKNTADITIPQIEIIQFQDELQSIKNEVSLKTKSDNIELAFSWINNKIKIKAPVERQSGLKYDVFISHKSADFEIAHNLYKYLVSKGKGVFLSEISLPKLGSTDFMKRIDEAIDNSKHMVVICSNTNYLNSGWVEAEWRMFINEKRSERKKATFLPLLLTLSQ